jgi:PST family polysaccharide transporter
VTEGNSYRTILRSSSIIGGSSLLNVLISLVRMKVVALLLGPAGVGVVGLFHNVLQVAGTVSGMGVGASGLRQIAAAQANSDADSLRLVRTTLFWTSLALGLFGAFVFVLFEDEIASFVILDPRWAGVLGWLAIGIILIVIYGNQIAVLNGLRRIGDIARIQVTSAFLASLIGIAFLLAWGTSGLIGYVLSASVASFLVALYFVRRSPTAGGRTPTGREVLSCARGLFALGIPYMWSGLINICGLLVVRIIVEHRLGTTSLGHFQAAWAIGMIYIGFILASMGTDYYPRLSGCIAEHAAARQLVNEQIEVAVLLAAPLVIGVLALAPWLVPLLYSKAFAPSSAILQWQLLGDILKVVSWPLSMVTLAAGAGRTYALTETAATVVLVLGVFLGIEAFGLIGTGVGYFVAYAVYLPIVYWLARRRIGFRLHRDVFWISVGSFFSASGVAILGVWSNLPAAIVGVAISGIFALYGLARLSHKADLRHLVDRLGWPLNKLIGIVGRYGH